jgi:hypothetical protein
MPFGNRLLITLMVEYMITEEHLLEKITLVLDILMMKQEMLLYLLNLLIAGY